MHFKPQHLFFSSKIQHFILLFGCTTEILNMFCALFGSFPLLFSFLFSPLPLSPSSSPSSSFSLSSLLFSSTDQHEKAFLMHKSYKFDLAMGYLDGQRSSATAYMERCTHTHVARFRRRVIRCNFCSLRLQREADHKEQTENIGEPQRQKIAHHKCSTGSAAVDSHICSNISSSRFVEL